MSTDRTKPKSRRAILAAAASSVAAVAAAGLAAPAKVLGSSGPMIYGAGNSAGFSDTGLVTSSAGTALSVENTGAGTGLSGKASTTSAIGVYGFGPYGYGVLGDTGAAASPSVPGPAGTWGRDWSTAGVGAAGTGTGGTAVVGYTAAGANEAAPPSAGEPTGVYGYAPGGTGVRARSDTGAALKVTGKASFSRSGRVAIGKGKAFVDVDLRTSGGLAGIPLCFANIQTRRPGVHVETVRPNYPIAGKMRIYLNKVASPTGSTTIAWIITD